MSKKENSEAAEKVAKAEKLDKKSSKANKAGKPNIFVRMGKSIKRFCKDFKGEIKKIQWPGGKEVLKSSCVVLLTVVVIGLAIFAIDWVLSEGLKLLMKVADKSYGETTKAAADAFIALKNFF